MHFELNKDNIILLTISGSQAYGLATEQSDLDLKGVAIAPKTIRDSLYKSFEQAENNPICLNFLREKEEEICKRCNKNPESVIYSLDKYLKLATDCNPNIIELLYVDEADILHQDDRYKFLRKHRDEFLSKKARFTFSGYAFAQIKRIKSHKKWLINPPTKRPERKDYNLPEVSTAQLEEANALVRKEINGWNFDDFQLNYELLEDLKNRVADKLTYTITALNIKSDLSELLDKNNIERAAMYKIGFDDNLIDLLFRENLYRRDLEHFKQYENWKVTRNPIRAALEEKYGFDSKHGAHVVRLLRMGKEILEGKGVIVKRPDREELLSIRNGAWTYEQLLEYAERLQNEMEELYKTSSLKHSPNKEQIDAIYYLCLNGKV